MHPPKMLTKFFNSAHNQIVFLLDANRTNSQRKTNKNDKNGRQTTTVTTSKEQEQNVDYIYNTNNQNYN